MCFPVVGLKISYYFLFQVKTMWNAIDARNIKSLMLESFMRDRESCPFSCMSQHFQHLKIIISFVLASF